VQFVGTGVHGQELQRVLDRTFLHPAPSQEAAAEVLGLSFSTYRRRLAAAIDAVTDVLWAVEIGERGDIGETSDQQLTNGWSGT
jgi:hypothetical protein